MHARIRYHRRRRVYRIQLPLKLRTVYPTDEASMRHMEHCIRNAHSLVTASMMHALLFMRVT